MRNPDDREGSAPGTPAFIVVRALTYGTLFVGLVLVFAPVRILASAGIPWRASPGPLTWAGIALAGAGAFVSASCVLAFAFAGKGTPAPFDPPRRLVVVGPYRYVRNPMYLGALLALGGAALVYRSWGLLAYAIFGFVAAELFVRTYEEPTLAERFGAEYREYRAHVRRWVPRRPGGGT